MPAGRASADGDLAVEGHDVESIEDFSDAFTVAVVEAASRLGHNDLVVGLEVGPKNWPVDVGWPDDKVAFVCDANTERDEWLTASGWKILTAASADEAVEVVRFHFGDPGDDS